MKAEFYTTIKELLLDIPGITSVSIWQNNLINDTDRMNRFPLIFVEFNEMNYNTMTGNIQECNGVQITIHVLFKALDAEDTGVFQISQDVFAQLQRANFRRISERPIYSGEEIIDWQIVFDSPRFTDEDAVSQTIKKPKPPIEIN